MDNKNELAVFHARSSQGMISAGYRLFMGNFRKLLRSSWVAAIGYALCMGALGSYYINEVPRITVMIISGMASADPTIVSQLSGTGAIMALLTLLFLAMATVIGSYGYAACREHMETGAITSPIHWYGRIHLHVLGRVAKGVLWLLAIGIVTGLLMVAVAYIAINYLSPITGTIAFCLIGIILLVALLPVVYCLTKYLLTPKSGFLKLFGPAYATGMHHLGGLFIVALVVTITTALLSLVVQLPANILYVANLQSQLGALQGDPLGMPEYMGKLNFVVFALMGFIQAYIHLSTIFPLYYLFGSFEKQEEERKLIIKN